MGKRKRRLSPCIVNESLEPMENRETTSTDSQFSVFLNYCGMDTRKNLADLLYYSLEKEHIETFRDDKKLPKGEKIENLLQAIGQSTISIPILSKNYASRVWCLRELTKIVECYKLQKQKILPIFYDVEPCVVREQSKSYKKTFLKHEKKFDEMTLEKWRAALREVTSLSGWDLQGTFNGRLGELANDVVSTVLKELRNSKGHGSFDEVNANKNFTRLLLEPIMGSKIEKQTEEVLECLRKEEFRIIGIFGLGGVGKTTLAMNIHDNLHKSSRAFDGVYWIPVSQHCTLYSLQGKIAEAVGVTLPSEGDEIIRAAKLSEALKGKGKFILFLDDVWAHVPLAKVGISDQIIEYKLIVTSRSFEICARMRCEKCFKVNPLTMVESWNLFKEKLGSDINITPETKKLALEITKECGGLPLAIITMASSMRGANGIEEWRDTLRKLKKLKKGHEGMDLDVFPVLKLSYDRLKDKQLQQCFLYCAVYPEDKHIHKQSLIDLLIDVGVIRDTTRQAEIDRGHTLINRLKSACLLESINDCQVKLHDLVRDMVLRIKESEFMVKARLSLREIPEEGEWANNSSESGFRS